MSHLLTVKAIYDGKRIKMPTINIHPCEVIITFLEDLLQSEDEKIFDILLSSDPAFDFLKSEQEDIYTDNDLVERFND